MPWIMYLSCVDPLGPETGNSSHVSFSDMDEGGDVGMFEEGGLREGMEDAASKGPQGKGEAARKGRSRINGRSRDGSEGEDRVGYAHGMCKGPTYMDFGSLLQKWRGGGEGSRVNHLNIVHACVHSRNHIVGRL